MRSARRFFPLIVLVALAGFAQQPAAKAVYAVTYIDVFPNFVADTNKLLLDLAANSRKEPGSKSVDILRDVERTNHFTIVEVWENHAAYDQHLMAAHTRNFRDKIQPYLGSPFDTRLYNLLQ
ncbi:MAG: antibiotic biosynthesis monooxygenase [Acidobacteriia bacterium]|nr:antibiotic biosynthesis monooxygenase [Terriglobia bacterium]